MICVDEFGPLELRPHSGRSWQRCKHPARFRATYTRRHGVRHLFAAYQVGKGQMWGRIRKRKRAKDFLAFLKEVRAKYTGRIWLVLDNLSAHQTKEILAYARENGIRFQFTPTNASWLNRIECQFTHLKKNVLTHCDYASFADMGRAIHRYLRWSNRRATQLLFEKRH